MISERDIKSELKRLPRLRKKAVKDGDFATALEIQHEIETLEWVLSDEY